MSVRGVKRERVLRVLLNQPNGSLTKYSLAKLCECSRPWVIELLSKLEAQGLVKQTKVLDSDALTKYWSQIHLKPKHWDYLLRDPLAFLEKIELTYALTTYQAENLLQHYLFPSRTDLFILEEDQMKWHRLIMDAGGLVGRGNLRLLITDRHVFYKALKLQDLTLVSPPQLVVDLLTEGGPCVEAAQLLLEKMSEHVLPAV